MADHTEALRPKYHYTPRRNFMNDPNGLTYLDGQFFLFHQFNPHGNTWGHIGWKQAVSTDLVNWTHLPMALAEEEGVMAFSGSAVADTENTSGFGRGDVPPLVAIYTGHRTADRQESQCLAYSQDRGRTWTKYAENPVLPWESNFRDPKVFWHEETRRWIMVVVRAAQKKACFYCSPNLRSWEFLSEFGPEGAPADTIPNWECPDLFPLPVEGATGEYRWVLHISVGGGHPNGGSGGQYFIGDFDGIQFTNDNSPDTALWSDYGRDCYAAVSWSGTAGARGEKYWIGWMSNWQYAEEVPTAPWRHGMTLPRLLTLRATPAGLRLIQQPIPQLETLRSARHSQEPLCLMPGHPTMLDDATGRTLEIAAEFEIGTASECGIAVRVGESEETRIGIDAVSRTVFVDRTQSGLLVTPGFPGRHSAPLGDMNGRVRLHIFVDSASVEVFVNDGLIVLTELIFPHPDSLQTYAYANGGEACLAHLDVWHLDPAVTTYRDAEGDATDRTHLVSERKMPIFAAAARVETR